MPVLDAPETPTHGLVAVARFDDLQAAREYALVLLAMNLDCLITVEDPGYVIHGEEAFAEAISEEFRLYAEEQENQVAVPETPVFGSGVNLAFLWVMVLLFIFAKQLQDASMTRQFLSSTSRMVEHGEWYRAFTSLFLHADLKHLMGNAVFGTIFGIFVANSFGPFRGWGLILLSGFFGNILGMVIQFPDPVRSLGASTAVFGALGLLVGSGLHQVWTSMTYQKGLRALGPLLAGVMIFTMNGIGGPGTDTLAHLTGMFSGVVFGLIVAFWMARAAEERSFVKKLRP